MAKKRAPRSSSARRAAAPKLRLKEAKEGSTGKTVEFVQKYLQTFGYLSVAATIGGVTGLLTGFPILAARLGLFDEATAVALRLFQHAHGLKPTGKLDAETIQLMIAPRCGVADAAMDPGALDSTNLGKWPDSEIKYFIKSPLHSSLDDDRARGTIFAAFKLWEDKVQLTFTEVSSPGSAHIRLSYEPMNHDNGCRQFLAGGQEVVLAHAFPPNGGDRRGRVHFYLAKNWTLDEEVARDQWPAITDFFSVAAHEIGHALGLAHNTQNDKALMHDMYLGPHPNLHADDIEAIQNIYPAR